MRFESLIIVTYGRSGSTLLQGLLNAIPRVLIRGENYNFAYGLYKSSVALWKTECEFGGPASANTENPWFGANQINSARFVDSLRSTMRCQLLGKADSRDFDCVGFKEIRYLPEDLGVDFDEYPIRIQSYLMFLSRLMPNLGIIFLTRDHDQICRSGWWRKNNPDDTKKSLRAFDAALSTFAATDLKFFTIDYAEILENGKKIDALFDFLDLPAAHGLVAKVLSRKHSF